MKKITFFTVCASLLLIGIACAQPTDSHVSTHVKDTIRVIGHGEVSAEPDKAIISISVSAINPNVNAAKAEADKKYQQVLAVAKAQGIERTDIKLLGINLNPEYEWRNNKQNLTGTRVNRSLAITVKKMSSVAPLLQGLVESNVSRIDRVQTGFKDRAGLERKALTAAIADAKEKAQFLASQFSKELSSAYSISEHVQQPTLRRFDDGMLRRQASAMSADLPPEHFGTQKVTAQVSVVFHAN